MKKGILAVILSLVASITFAQTALSQPTGSWRLKPDEIVSQGTIGESGSVDFFLLVSRNDVQPFNSETLSISFRPDGSAVLTDAAGNARTGLVKYFEVNEDGAHAYVLDILTISPIAEHRFVFESDFALAPNAKAEGTEALVGKFALPHWAHFAMTRTSP